MYGGDQRLYLGFCFAQRGAVTWHGLQSFQGRQGEFAGLRVITNGGRGSACASSVRGGRGLWWHPDPAQETGCGWSASWNGSLSLDEIYSMLSWSIDPLCCLVGEIVGLFCSFLCPGNLVWACCFRCSGSKRVAAP